MTKLNVLTIVFLAIIASIGIFTRDVKDVSTIVNFFGEEVTLYGVGVYAYETVFRAGILIGTDIVMLFLIVPLLTVLTLRKDTTTNRVITLGVLGVIMYYALVTVFSIRYNQFYLLYVLLFASAMFNFIYMMILLPYETITLNLKQKDIPKGVTVYLIFAGLSVFVWLFEIIENIIHNSAPMHIGTLHTEPTYLIDLVFIPTTCLIARYLIKKREGLGLVLASIMAFISVAIALIVLSQSSVHLYLSVLPSLDQVVIYVTSFLVLSTFSTYYFVKLIAILKEQ